tara:strand:+ start:967 stop:1470 length:504 start_codon:yes stop_codon:yes gene_type:complete
LITQNPVLVLNQNYQPLNICNVKRALALILLEKAESTVHSKEFIKSPSKSFNIPIVIRLMSYIHKPIHPKKISRQGVLFRDKNTCQYCGISSESLTLDHVIPKSRGGKHIWENVVAACIKCNHKKAGYTPQEAKMQLINKAKIPNINSNYILQSKNIKEWKPFLVSV